MNLITESDSAYTLLFIYFYIYVDECMQLHKCTTTITFNKPAGNVEKTFYFYKKYFST